MALSIKAFRISLVAVCIPGPGGREVPGIVFSEIGEARSRVVSHSVIMRVTVRLG
jgi:hypothetical protein